MSVLEQIVYEDLHHTLFTPFDVVKRNSINEAGLRHAGEVNAALRTLHVTEAFTPTVNPVEGQLISKS